MLDEKDLQAIAQLINGAVEPITKRLDNIEQDIKDMKGDIKNLQDDVKIIKKTTVRIERKMDSGISYLDASIEKLDRKLTYETTMLKKTDMGIMEDLEHLTV